MQPNGHSSAATVAPIAPEAVPDEKQLRAQIDGLKKKMELLDQRREILLKSKPSVGHHLPACAEPPSAPSGPAMSLTDLTCAGQRAI